jgi:hypothetical protein
MTRFTLMSRLGLAEPLVRLARTVENSNRASAARASVTPVRPRLRFEAHPGERPI